MCALVALWSWTDFGKLHAIYVDAPGVTEASPGRKKIERHLPFHFHEFFHYYVGAKYFRELGYEGLYDCTALADAELADEQHVRPRIGGWVRDLDDVLLDKTYDEAKAHCRDQLYPHFSAGRWRAFKDDLRELQRLVPDEWWGGVVFDAGFNPPPSWIVVGAAIANTIPIRAAGVSTFLAATALDAVLLVVCVLALRRAFGDVVAATAVVFFGATFVATYAWNGGAFLRYSWVTALVLGLAATKRGRWTLAGAMFAAATCDRLFPVGFAIGAVVPVVARVVRAAIRREAAVDDRRRLLQFARGFGATAAVLVAVSVAFYGVSSWQVFFSRILRHGDVYYVMHIGLKKVLTWRDWVPSQDFRNHYGLANFHDWNMRLHATWRAMRPIAIPIQLFAAAGAALASMRRRPYEASLLCGVCAMFFFNIPANYYYVVLALVPAVLLRAAMTAPTVTRRLREYAALTGFTLFWVTTLLSSRWTPDDIVYNHLISVALLLFLVAWIALWIQMEPRRWLLAR